MDHFNYKNGSLHAEEVALSSIADAVGTPFYCYSSSTLEMHYKAFMDAFDGQGQKDRAMICYSVKANSNLAVLRTLADLGAGMDVVSEGELMRVQAAGVPGGRIVFSGVGKRDSELRLALEADIRQFNVESEPELERLSELAMEMNKTAIVALRINPNVDANTHEKIATGKAENKFGIPISRASEVYAWGAKLPNVELKGIDVHIGSQLTDLEPFSNAFFLIRELTETLRREGHHIEQLDLGGGLGISYEPDSNESPPSPNEYAAVVCKALGDLDCDLLFEPGRSMAGNAGVLVSQVVFVKQGEDRSFVIVDAAMNDLIRPTLYGAYHHILPLDENSSHETITADIVGPVCETGDTFGKLRQIPKVVRGDYISLMSAGAYGAVQASTYNSRLLIPEVLVKDDQFAVVRARPSYKDLLALDSKAPWQED
jgi:diaminopimelate decarboxylase